MAWLYQKSAQHVCNKPDFKGAAAGDIWQCEQCKTCYTVEFYNWHDGYYWKLSSGADLRARGLARTEQD